MFELKTISGMSDLNDSLIAMASDIQSKSELNAFKRMLRSAVEKSLEPVLASVIANIYSAHSDSCLVYFLKMA